MSVFCAQSECMALGLEWLYSSKELCEGKKYHRFKLFQQMFGQNWMKPAQRKVSMEQFRQSEIAASHNTLSELIDKSHEALCDPQGLLPLYFRDNFYKVQRPQWLIFAWEDDSVICTLCNFWCIYGTKLNLRFNFEQAQLLSVHHT